MNTFETPVLFLVFNRPEHTRKVFERIRELRPKYLFVAGDGPRRHHLEDLEKCIQVREIINKGIDWDCEFKILFREENLGCGKAVSTAITWFFENVEAGIILEDDCLPGVSFFQFCSQLLEYYKNDEEIMHIGGNNFQNGQNMQDYSYYFSAYSHNWGWATWKRCWTKFNILIPQENIANLTVRMKDYAFNSEEVNYWIKIFERQSQSRQADIWDYQWLFAIWLNNGLCIVPRVNLVRNIGFDNSGTHTREAHNFLSITSGNLNDFRHPDKKKINVKADHYTFNNYYFIKTSFIVRAVSNIKSLLKLKF